MTTIHLTLSKDDLRVLDRALLVYAGDHVERNHVLKQVGNLRDRVLDALAKKIGSIIETGSFEAAGR